MHGDMIARHTVSFTEEPDVGNPQVRFCEGHGLPQCLKVKN